MLDCLIIGKGPAGISAAIYLARANKQIKVVGKDYGALERAVSIENYYGTAPMSGKELAEKGIAQAESLGVEVLTDEVVSIQWNGDFTVRTVTDEFEAKTVLLAVGKSRRTPALPGLETYRGKGVSFCAVCDGFLYRNKPVAVIGAGEYAAEEAGVLLQFAQQVTVFTDGAEPVVMPEGCVIVKDKLKELTGGEYVERVVTAEREYETAGVFVALGTAGASQFALKLGVQEKDGSILVDDQMQTDLPGFFAAGDCVGGFLQVAKAVSDGAIASRGILAYLRAGE